MKSWRRQPFLREVFSPPNPLFPKNFHTGRQRSWCWPTGTTADRRCAAVVASILDRCRQCKGLWKGVWGEPFSSRKVPPRSSLHFAQVLRSITPACCVERHRGGIIHTIPGSRARPEAHPSQQRFDRKNNRGAIYQGLEEVL